MSNDNIIEKLLNDDFIEYSKEDLYLMLEEELEKSYYDRDYDLIRELTRSLMIIEEKDIDIDIDSKIDSIINEYENRKRHRHKILRIPTVACIIFVIFFSINIVSMSVFNMDLFGEIIEFGEEIVKFDFNKQKDKFIELEISDKDPYGLKKEIDRLGISSMLPTYIPEGFKLINLESEKVEESSYTYLLLNYKKKKDILNFDIIKFDEQISRNLGIPNENGNVQKLNINGIDVFIVSEDNWYKGIFSDGLIVYNVSSTLDYETFIKILESFK